MLPHTPGPYKQHRGQHDPRPGQLQNTGWLVEEQGLESEGNHNVGSVVHQAHDVSLLKSDGQDDEDIGDVSDEGEEENVEPLLTTGRETLTLKDEYDSKILHDGDEPD